MEPVLHRTWHQDKKQALGLLNDLLQRLWAQGQAREQLKEVLCCETGGRFRLVEASQMHICGEPIWQQDLPGAKATAELRERLRELQDVLGLDDDEIFELELAVGEVCGNVVKHATQGRSKIYSFPDKVVVEISDDGPGIQPENLRASVLMPGFSTIDSLGMGFTLILTLVDKVWLATGAGGTRVILSKNRKQGLGDVSLKAS